MKNGRDAEVNAILASGREEIDKYLVLSAMESRDSIHQLNDAVEDLKEELRITKQIKHWLQIAASAAVTAVFLEAVHLLFPHLG